MEIQDYQQSDYVLRDLHATAKWGVFLSIIGFAFTGIYMAVAIYSSRFIQLPAGFPAFAHHYAAEFKAIFLLVPGLVYFIPNFFFYKLSRATLNALTGEEVTLLPNEIMLHRRTIEQLGTLMIVALAFISVVIIRLLLTSSI
ncbi:hypothetical protein [Prolixibacter denitrificans]|uniref:Uncharacterized protein n=1 Tax=Prolixibacter denitrificans TaxID=1541063 RepID=A0A2P8CBX0_9BACT|nr:hypothetical protein [Prolixibacter denitrificans]PSK82461.1 hypothetical protein CLV93_106209 [Prolixibacter denitrificans]GET22797.1 hypothetical protein JCM18694_30430 [Prolixibacter denitrificans]